MGAVRIGGPLLFERPWKRLGIDAVLKGVLAGRQLGFDVERAVFVATLLRENKSHVQLVRSCPGFKGQRQPGNHKSVNHLTYPETASKRYKSDLPCLHSSRILDFDAASSLAI